MFKGLARSAALAALVGLALMPAAPAHATVHEIVAQWCSGHDELEPPGVSGRSHADNFAKPLNASGFIAGVVPFEGPDGPGLLVQFDYGHPAAKVQGTGVFITIDPTVPLYLELIEPNPDFPAFRHCPGLAG